MSTGGLFDRSRFRVADLQIFEVSRNSEELSLEAEHYPNPDLVCYHWERMTSLQFSCDSLLTTTSATPLLGCYTSAALDDGIRHLRLQQCWEIAIQHMTYVFCSIQHSLVILAPPPSVCMRRRSCVVFRLYKGHLSSYNPVSYVQMSTCSNSS